MAEEWRIRKTQILDHVGQPCPLNDLWPLIDAAGAWHADPSPANTERLAAVVGAMQTLGIMVPAGEGATDGE